MMKLVLCTVSFLITSVFLLVLVLRHNNDSVPLGGGDFSEIVTNENEKPHDVAENPRQIASEKKFNSKVPSRDLLGQAQASKLETIFNTENDYWERSKRLKNLNWSGLTGSEIESIARFLLSRSKDAQHPVSEFAIRNDLLRGLIDLNNYKDVVMQLFTEIPSDRENHHLLWREYVLQHASVFLQRYNEDRDNPSYPGKLFEVLEASMTEIDTGIAGTAFLNIYRIRGNYPELYQKYNLNQRAGETVLNPNADLATRISAVSVLQNHAVELNSEALLSVYKDEKTGTVLRSAILRRLLDTNSEEAKKAVMAARGDTKSLILKNILRHE